MRTVFIAILILAFAVVVGCEERATTGSDETTNPTTGPQREENTQGEGTQGDTAQREQQQQQDVFTAVTVSLVGSDSEGAVKGTDGRYHVVYELLLTNAKAVPATLESVEVLNADDGTTVLRREGDELVALMRTLDAQPAENVALPPNESRMVYLTVRFDAEDAIPATLSHRFELMAADSPAATEPAQISYEAAPVDLWNREVPVFAPPLKGKGWVAINGCCGPEGVHRSSVQTVNAKLYDSQRFAIDWMDIDEDGQLVVGDPSKVENWVSYGKQVVAAADGVVVGALDGLEDNVPGELPDPTTITVQNVDGNHVIIDHGNGFYSFYAHLKPGSVEVEIGDRVQSGDQLGLLGNTGNSSAPHLHFHVMSSPSALGSDGIPYVIDSFERAGRGTDASFDEALKGGASFPSLDERDAVERQDELPLDNVIVNFPGAQ